MKKTKLKSLFIVFLSILLISTFSFATDANTPEARTTAADTNQTAENVTATGEDVNTTDIDPYDSEGEENIDLDIVEKSYTETGFNINFDKFVNGNVFLYGNNITITDTSAINGDLFIFGYDVTFKPNFQINGNVYCVAANKISFEGLTYGGLYASAKVIECKEYAQLYLGAKIMADEIIFAGASGSNVYFMANKSISITDTGYVSGNIVYYSTTEPTVADNAEISGEIIANKFTTISENVFVSHIESYISLLCFALIVLLIILAFNRKYVDGENKFSIIDYLKAFGIGLLSLIVLAIVIIILWLNTITALLGFILLALTLLLLILGVVTVLIKISTCCYHKFAKGSNSNLVVLFLVLTTLVYYALLIIPYAGSILFVILTFTGFGQLILLLLNKMRNSNTPETNTETIAEKVTIAEEPKEIEKEKQVTKTEKVVDKVTETKKTVDKPKETNKNTQNKKYNKPKKDDKSK